MKKRINLWPLYLYERTDDGETEHHVNLWMLYFLALGVIYIVTAFDG